MFNNNCADDICTIVTGAYCLIELCNRPLHNFCGMLGLICYSTMDSEQTIILFNFDTTSICVDGNTCAYR